PFFCQRESDELHSKLWDPDPDPICCVERGVKEKKQQQSAKKFLHKKSPLFPVANASSVSSASIQNPKAATRTKNQNYLIPISLCASLRIERSAISVREISRSTLPTRLASSTTRRSPFSGKLPSSLKVFQTDS